MTTTEIIPRTTLTQMAVAWRQATADITSAFELLVKAESELRAGFNGTEHWDFDLDRNKYRRVSFENPQTLIAELKKQAWRILIEKMELRRVLSIKRAQELDHQLETGEGLPDIEETQILAMLEGTMNNIPQFIEECVREVFDWLLPQWNSWQVQDYKTNQKFEDQLGDRIIKEWCVERKYSGRGFHRNYHREKELRALDNVFHALDGKGFTASYNGELCDAIDKSEDGRGTTTYFEFKCFQNGNLHLKFRRMDLVEKMNQIASGMRLKEPKAA